MYIFKLAKITAIQFLLLIFGAKIQMLFNETFLVVFKHCQVVFKVILRPSRLRFTDAFSRGRQSMHE